MLFINDKLYKNNKMIQTIVNIEVFLGFDEEQ